MASRKSSLVFSLDEHGGGGSGERGGGGSAKQMVNSSITLLTNEVHSSTGWITGAVTTFVLRLGFILLKHLNGHRLMPRFLQRVLNLVTDIPRLSAA